MSQYLTLNSHQSGSPGHYELLCQTIICGLQFRIYHSYSLQADQVAAGAGTQCHFVQLGSGLCHQQT